MTSKIETSCQIFRYTSDTDCTLNFTCDSSNCYSVQITAQMSPTMAWAPTSAVRLTPQASASNTSICARRVATIAAAALLTSASLQSLTPQAIAADVAVYDHDKTLSGVDFSKRDLTRAVFTKAVCDKANFSGAKLDGAQLDDASVSTITAPYPISAHLTHR